MGDLMARKWWTLLAVCVGIFMLLLDITIVNVALPQIAASFNASLSSLQWVIDAYALALASLLLTAGTLADRQGRRRLFLIGVAVFTVGSALCGLATGMTFLALARAFQGIGGAIMFATSLALLSQSFQGKERGIAFGIYGGITGLAIATGPVIGGAIVTGLGWRWIFLVNIPVGVILFAIAWFRVNESRDPEPKRLDIPGFITFSTGLFALIFALIRANHDGWGSPVVIGSLVAAALLLGAFVAVELLRRDPMFDFGLLRVPTFDGGLVAAFAVSASIFAVLPYLTLWVQGLLGYSALAAGVRFLPLSLSVFFTAAIAGRLTSFVAKKYLIGPGFALIGVGLLLMRGLTPASDWSHLLPGLIICGVGAGLVNVPLIATAVGVVAPRRAGMASGINSTFRQVGLATGIAVLGTIFASHIRSNVVGDLAGTPAGAFSGQIADAIEGGQLRLILERVPETARQAVETAARTGFVDALNLILIIAGVLSFLAAITSFFLIREKDFVEDQGRFVSEQERSAA
jgi:EmrB/QacA subfamily drug resistance transporter